MPRGQPAPRLVDVLVDEPGELDRALVAGPEDGDHHRRLDVEPGALVGLLEAVHDGRHVAEAQAAAVGPRPEDEVLELGPPVGLPDRPQQDLPPLRPHGPARQVERRPAHRLRHLVERHPVPPQVVLRDLDRDLVGRRAHDVDLRDLRNRGQLVPDALGDLLQRERVDVAGDRYVDDLLPHRHLADDGLLGLDREGGDGVDVALDLVDDAAGVRPEVELDHHRAHPLGGRRLELLDAVDALDRFLDADVHRLLDLLRGGAEIRNLDVDPIELDFRERLLPHVRRGERAAHQDERHHQVGGHAVAREPVDHSSHERIPLTSVFLSRTCSSHERSRGEPASRSFISLSSLSRCPARRSVVRDRGAGNGYRPPGRASTAPGRPRGGRFAASCPRRCRKRRCRPARSSGQIQRKSRSLRRRTQRRKCRGASSQAGGAGAEHGACDGVRQVPVRPGDLRTAQAGAEAAPRLCLQYRGRPPTARTPTSGARRPGTARPRRAAGRRGARGEGQVSHKDPIREAG